MEIQEFNEKMVNKIARFFEQKDNWNKMKECWLFNDRSDGLRRLLREAINQSDER